MVLEYIIRRGVKYFRKIGRGERLRVLLYTVVSRVGRERGLIFVVL